MPNNESVLKDLPEHVFEVAAGGLSYRMLLPNADVDYIQRKLATEHAPYESTMLEDMRSRLSPGDLVIDAGANIGNHTMYLAAAGCRVAAFEPNPALAHALRTSVALNGLEDKVEVRELALGKAEGKGRFVKEIPENLGAQSIGGGDGPLTISPLDAVTLPVPVKAIKIDVEGMEFDVLDGAAGLIGRDRPIVYVECSDEASFRQVQQWMALRDYGYWQTFNVTPTHLFLPNEQTSVEQRLARLQSQGAQETYQLKQQMAKTREMLDSANLKYRAANEQIASLKVQLAQQEDTRRRAEHAANDAAGQLAQTRERLEAERGALHQDVLRLGTLAESHREAAHQAEKQLAKLEAALEAARADALREADAARAMTAQLEQARDELAATRNRVAQADHQYLASVEQAGVLRRQMEEQEALNRQAVKFAAENNSQLLATQTRLLEDRTALLAEIRTLREQGQAANQAAHEVEKRLVRVEAELKTANDNQAAADTRHREAVEQVNALRQRVAQEEQAARTAEKLWDQAQAELHQLRSDLDNMTVRHQQAAEQATAREAELRQRVAHEAQAALAAESLWGEAQAELHELKAELNQVTAGRHEASERAAALGSQLAVQSSALRDAEQVQQATTARLARTESALEQANVKYRHVTSEQVPQLKAAVEAGKAQVRERQHSLERIKLELGASKRALAEANTQLERARQQKIQAEQQVVKTRASLSFQLGYILIHGFKSPRAFFGMPKALLAWRRETIKRRTQKQERLDKLSVAAIPPAHARVPAAAPQPMPRPVAQPMPQPAPQQSLQPVAMAVEAQTAAPSLRQADAAPVALAAPVLDKAVNDVVAPKTWPADLRQLKVACIMDEFTFGSYRAECDLFQLTPANWHAELEDFKPQLLFIESAWRGKDELWGSKVGHNSQELQGIVAWCRQHGVPTVFWNKEDPVHFETFLGTATLFDCVFTTDIDCIHRYKAALQHDNVFLLPFACQPKNNHPIETYQRKDAFCFAGAYYVRYPDRTRDLGNFVAELPAFRPLEIYDRNFGKSDPNYQFPPEYQPYIVGTLPFDQIDKAYKGYRYAINLNSIKQSQTMFARRVFELMASNTVTVSNFSRGIRLMFGDLVITTDSGAEMVRHLNEVAGDDVRSAKLRLAALRKVLQEHTYEQRLAYVFSKVSGQEATVRQPAMAVLAAARNQHELSLVLGNFTRQHYPHRSLTVMLADGFVPAAGAMDARVRLLPQGQCAALDVAALAGGADFVAGMVAQDYYGPNYLADIALATTYSQATVTGKKAHYALEGGVARLQAAGESYRPAARFEARSAAVRLALVANQPAAAWIAALATAQVDTQDGLAIDEFNYCRDGQADGAATAAVKEAVDDLAGLDTGVPIGALLRLAEGIAPAAEDGRAADMITGRRLAQAFGKAPSAAVQLEVDVDQWHVSSSLPDGKHEYLYATKDFTLAELGWTDKAQFYFDTTPGLNLQLVVVFLDAQKQKISNVIKNANRNQEADIPLGTVAIRLGLRFYAGGSTDIKGLVLGHRNLQPAEIIGKADRLILTNHYPSYDDLYRNGFVHSRTVAYRERGIRCDVFRMRPDEPVSYHEFEDTDVTTGSQEVLSQMLSSGRYKTVMVHFLDPAMWEVLQHHIDRVKVVVWVHGAEIQPWHRRDYNYANEEERTVAKMKSDARMAFWRGLLQTMPANLRLVFVSRYFAEEVMEDLGFRIPEQHYSIIHNPIDTGNFRYEEKPVEQRLKVLSIRSYASLKYANDLSVEAIMLLAKKPWFDQMQFRLVGDGPLFDKTVEPLREFSNVLIEQRFLKQSEIAALQKDYGIFLTPTRWDSQGVSRDEAMSAGLVPATNAVSAIPEFVDETCAILAPPDDAAMLAEGIAAMFEAPEKFSAMSKAASDRVVRQRNKHQMIDAEIRVMS
jgi:FkbM family methyltransferase